MQIVFYFFFKHPLLSYLNILNAAEAYGLPKLPPYLARFHHHRVDFRQGVNFAVAGATALDPAFFQRINVATNTRTNNSLSVQMGWFEQFKSSLCETTQGHEH